MQLPLEPFSPIAGELLSVPALSFIPHALLCWRMPSVWTAALLLTHAQSCRAVMLSNAEGLQELRDES